MLRRKSSVVQIGDTPLGGNNPVRIQSMTNTSTLDTEGSIRQCIRIIEAGGEYVRLTAQGVREAENLQNIRDGLRALNYSTPLIADIHFNPKAAETAARIVEKVRINPGNFAPDFEKIQERFIPFLNICKKHGTAIRIGVNHGSLSERILNRYGDTPEGMVESCMEFLRICVAEHFENVVISMKASSTWVMVHAVLLLAKQMEREGMAFPLHLGVTEAGEGEDGRIKSAVGIGALLAEGIGDTIRVSLSEDPEAEIPVARLLVDYIQKQSAEIFVLPNVEEGRATGIPLVISDRSKISDVIDNDSNRIPDRIYTGKSTEMTAVDASELTEEIISQLKQQPENLILLHAKNNNSYAQKAAIAVLQKASVANPVILWNTYNESDLSAFQIKAAADCGSFFLDRLVGGLMLSNTNPVLSPQAIDACSFGILQAAGRRITQTEYISCPSCGRTLFDLQTVLHKVKAATSHLKGLKIAVMGCIVNGPGEMADADYGYVGASKGKISLYKGKTCVMKNIPEEEAVERLIELIDSCEK
ncbi:MAG: (E)-4-hydroxy-3-methylbut-2-enyl-diphosphate synthase [Dysgonamonadaceae bacterium]|jgi:(E)-4-hydroxy-3-methylbut-2-enyl-diphosphate synthase|nr:(E)-4-hydroxy-3-methylbut-2-enyl-diphosphate synthase [Dysgonamonadaceae bacterium]